MFRLAYIFLTTIGFLPLFLSSPALSASFTPLGTFPGGVVVPGFTRSIATGISNDGNVVSGFGYVALSQSHAFRWTAATGTIDLGSLGGQSFSSANGVSGDGSTIVGQTTTPFSGNDPLAVEPFRWTDSLGMLSLEGAGLPSFLARESATAANFSGQEIVGNAQYNPGEAAFRGAFFWNQNGIFDLDDLPGGIYGNSTNDFDSEANSISDFGSVIVGQGLGNNGYEAVRWNASFTPDPLGCLSCTGADQFNFISKANAVSGDGSIIVGTALNSLGIKEAFTWTESSGMIGLGTVDGVGQSFASGISSDGSVVVGNSNNRAFVWDSVNGMRNIQNILTNAGIDLTGWLLTEAVDVSADGRVVVGIGENPNSEREAWRAVLPPFPTTPSPDLNGDGFVDSVDLGILLGNWNMNAFPHRGELDGIPPVDSVDLGLLLGAWDPPPQIASTSVPEPNGIILALTAFCWMLYRL